MLLSRNAVRHAIGVSFLLLILPALLPGTARGQSPVSTIAYGPSPSVAPDSRPLIQVSLSRPIYRIHIDAKTGAPQMPKDVTATAEVVNWPAGLERPQDFTWHVFLDWDFKPCPTHHSISDRTFTHSSPLKVDFGNEIRGGTLTVFAKTWLNGQEIWGKAHALVLGENPSRRTILRAFPPNRFGLLASKIGMVESDLCQFTAANGVDPGGMPVLSRTNDVGMMQLNAPTGSITSADQVWDWRANLRRGLEMLEGKRQITVLASRHAENLQRVPSEWVDPGYQALACLNVLRVLQGQPCLSAPPIPPLSDKPGTGILPGEPDPDHLQLSQLEREAIRRYNGGREYAFTILPDLNTLDIRAAEWQPDPTRGGIQPHSGDPNYVLHVLGARSGFTLPPPPKPAKHGHRASRHRRHHK